MVRGYAETAPDKIIFPPAHCCLPSAKCHLPHTTESTKHAVKPPPLTKEEYTRFDVPDALLRLNHYVSKSEEEWAAKKRRGHADGNHVARFGPPPESYSRVVDLRAPATVLRACDWASEVALGDRGAGLDASAAAAALLRTQKWCARRGHGDAQVLAHSTYPNVTALLLSDYCAALPLQNQGSGELKDATLNSSRNSGPLLTRACAGLLFSDPRKS